MLSVSIQIVKMECRLATTGQHAVVCLQAQQLAPRLGGAEGR